MKKFSRLEIISFVTGFALMAFELVAARLLAPSIGASMYVWTGVIGVIIAALSLGYYVGGRVADARNRASDVAWLLIVGALLIGLVRLVYLPILAWLSTSEFDVRLQAVLASLLLFAPASFVLGTVSPYLAKLNVRSLKTSGQAVAHLSALNAVGGIMGTFVTGFILFGLLGSRETLVLIVVLVLAASWLVVPRTVSWQRLAGCGATIVLALLPVATPGVIASIDTPSARYDILRGDFRGQTVTALVTGPDGIQSAVRTDGSDAPVFWYTKTMAELALRQKPTSILLLGGGTFTLPNYLAPRLPNSRIDVVEIDPELQAIARQYFYYRAPSNVRAIASDARTFVNTAQRQYDLILVDVYGDGIIPFALATKEYGQSLQRLLRPDGRIVANLIGAEAGPCRRLLETISATYTEVLPYRLLATEADRPRTASGNYIAVYSRTPLQLPGFSALPSTATALSDNFAPTEQLYYTCRQSQ